MNNGQLMPQYYNNGNHPFDYPVYEEQEYEEQPNGNC